MNANIYSNTQTHIRTRTYTCTITDSRQSCLSCFQAHILCCNDGLCLSPFLPLPPSPSPSTFLSPLLPFFLSPSVSSSVYLLPSPSPGRRSRFPTLRQWNGLSGFTKRKESEYDCFGAGHSSTSISAALGVCLFSYHQESSMYMEENFTRACIYLTCFGCGAPRQRLACLYVHLRDKKHVYIQETHTYYFFWRGTIQQQCSMHVSIFIYVKRDKV